MEMLQNMSSSDDEEEEAADIGTEKGEENKHADEEEKV